MDAFGNWIDIVPPALKKRPGKSRKTFKVSTLPGFNLLKSPRYSGTLGEYLMNFGQIKEEEGCLQEEFQTSVFIVLQNQRSNESRHHNTTSNISSSTNLEIQNTYLLAKKICRLVNLTTNIHALINAHPQSTIRTGAEFAQFFTLNELFLGILTPPNTNLLQNIGVVSSDVYQQICFTNMNLYKI